VADPTLDDLIEFWIGRCRSTLPESEHHRRVMATATHLRRLRALDAAVQRVRELPQENEDVGNTHDEWFAKGYNAAMNAVARALDGTGGMTVAAAVQRVRHAGGGVLLAFNDWPAYHSPLADGERRRALNALAEAIAALDAGGGA